MQLKDIVVQEAKDNKEYEQLFAKLVPGSGAAKTVEGELLRAVSKVGYRWNNDGDYFFTGYGAETAGSAASFLADSDIPGMHSLVSKTEDKYDNAYDAAIDKMVAMVVAYVKSKGEDLTPNTHDMLDHPNHYEHRAHEDDESEDDEDEYDDED